jgi:tetratricopeptide (TPR) repeat protein
VLVVVDNLHWVDTETRGLLERLAGDLASARLVLLVSARPGGARAFDSRQDCTELVLDTLSADGAEALLGALLGYDAELAPLKLLLAARTGGNPLFLEESVRDLAETGGLVGERGAYRLARPLASVHVPERVQALLAARVDRLPAPQKTLLQVASVIGTDVPFALLQTVSAVPAEDLLRRLGDLEAADVLHAVRLYPDRAYAFKHALLHDVVYAGLLREHRRPLHARIVDALESLHRERLSEHVEALAHHALRAEAWGKAVQYLRQAAAGAGARSANHEAVECLQQALEALGHLPEGPERTAQEIDIRLELRPALLQLGRLEDLIVRSREAEAMAAAAGDDHRLARAYSSFINYHYLRGEPDAAIDYGNRCLALAEKVDDRALASLARRYLGHSYHAQGQYSFAVRILADDLASLATSAIGEDTAAVTAYVASCGWLAFALAELGEFENADAYVERARTLADSSGHPYSQAIAATLAGLVALVRGEPADGLAALTRGLDLCRTSRLAVWRPIPSSALGLCLARLDRKGDALPLLEDGVRLSEKLGVKAYLARWTAHLAEGILRGGDTTRAGVLVRRALDLARAHREQGHEAAALSLLGDIAALDASATADAAIHYGEATALAEPLGMRPLLGRIHLAWGRLARRLGDAPEAEAHLARAIALFSETGMRSLLAESDADLRALGRLVIVDRTKPELYADLSREFAGDPEIRVILDRRARERRLIARGTGPDRRHDERRRLAIEDRLRERGLAIV